MQSWATGVSFEGGRFVAQLESADGQRRVVDLAELGKHGVPAHGKDSRKLNVPLQAFERGDRAACHAVTGLPAGQLHRHTIYTFKSTRHTLFLPALVLMRALFQPASVALPAMFQPQGLERLVLPCTDDGTGAVAWQNLPGYQRAQTERASSVMAALSWMYAYPGARAMCGSVHEFAKLGAIDLTLPPAQARMMYRGKKVGDIFLVDWVSLRHILPEEEPFAFASRHPRTVPLRALTANLLAEEADATWLAEPLTDDEWSELAPLLTSRRAGERYERRTLFDLIRHRMATEVMWDELPGSKALHASARFALHTWRRRGLWEPAMARLRALRGAA